MLIIYRVVLPILLIIFVLMGLWVNFLFCIRLGDVHRHGFGSVSCNNCG
jgi:hypothetical protein